MTSLNLPAYNNPPVLMDTLHTITFRGKRLIEVIIKNTNVQTRFKAQAGFVRNRVVVYLTLYIYHDTLTKYYLIK